MQNHENTVLIVYYWLLSEPAADAADTLRISGFRLMDFRRPRADFLDFLPNPLIVGCLLRYYYEIGLATIANTTLQSYLLCFDVRIRPPEDSVEAAELGLGEPRVWVLVYQVQAGQYQSLKSRKRQIKMNITLYTMQDWQKHTYPSHIVEVFRGICFNAVRLLGVPVQDRLQLAIPFDIWVT